MKHPIEAIKFSDYKQLLQERRNNHQRTQPSSEISHSRCAQDHGTQGSQHSNK